jgi:hypothetical protein
VTWIISSTADLRTYVDNEHPDAVEHDLADALVYALQAAPHPDYGTDWADWLSDNASGYLEEVSRASDERAAIATEGPEGGFPGHSEDA